MSDQASSSVRRGSRADHHRSTASPSPFERRYWLGPFGSALRKTEVPATRVGMFAGRVVFDGVPAALTDATARDLYGLEAGDVVGHAAPPPMLPAGVQPGFAFAGS